MNPSEVEVEEGFDVVLSFSVLEHLGERFFPQNWKYKLCLNFRSGSFRGRRSPLGRPGDDGSGEVSHEGGGEDGGGAAGGEQGCAGVQLTQVKWL